MKGSRFAGLTALAVVLAIAGIAASIAPAAGAAAPAITQAPNTVRVGFAITKFVPRNGKLTAIGQAITTYQSTDGHQYTSATPFSAQVKRIHASRSSVRGVQAATRICDVLNLTLGPLHLELLGLIVDLNQVNLSIRADSNGGLLGGLLCGLAGSSGLPGIGQQAAQLTKVAKTSGLSAGPGFTAPLQTAAPGTQQVAAVCTVLDLMLGPIDVNLLGLMVHLGGGASGTDPVHLMLTADPTKGLLGSLLCSLAGGVPAG